MLTYSDVGLVLLCSGYQAVPAGMSCVHFVVCDSSTDIQGRVDPDVSFTDLVMLRPFCAAFVLTLAYAGVC